MKFLLFNVAVVVALFVLFNPDRADLRAVADRAYEAVGLARETAKDVAEKIKVTEPETPEPAPSPEPPKTAAPQTVAAEVPADLKPAEPVSAEPHPVEMKPADARPADATPVEPPPQALDPAVAKRRAEVLGEGPLPPAEDRLMSPEQRRRELFNLAEEMELFYVKRLSR